MERAKKLKLGELVTLSGRYYAMDRDNRWERIKKTYDAMVYGKGNEFPRYEVCFNEHYKRGITDEFINPSIITKGNLISDNDAILFINFRSERMKELIETFTNKTFKMFETKEFKGLKLYSLFNIHEDVEYAFDIERPTQTFGEYIDGLDFTQARIAETEKYAHVRIK